MKPTPLFTPEEINAIIEPLVDLINASPQEQDGKRDLVIKAVAETTAFKKLEGKLVYEMIMNEEVKP